MQHAQLTDAQAPLDLNTASVAALTDEFPDLGLFGAEDIVSWRAKHGPFRDVTQLTDELGIEVALAKRLSEHIRVAVPVVSSGDETGPASEIVNENEPTRATAPEVPEATEVRESNVAHEAPETTSEFAAAAPVTIAESAEREVIDAESIAVSLPADPESVQTPTAATIPLTDLAASATADEPDVFAPDEPDVFTKEEHEEAPSETVEATAAQDAAMDSPPSSVFDGDAHPSMIASMPVESGPTTDEPIERSEAASQHIQLAPPLEPSHAPSEDAPASAPKRKLGGSGMVVGILAALNIGVIGGLISVKQEVPRASAAPIASISAEVKELQTQHAETQAKLEETRVRVEKQGASIAKAMDAVAATDERQRNAERDAKEQAAKEAKELAAFANRLRQVERKVDDEVYTIEEAVKIVDMVHGGRPAPRPSHERGVSPAAPAKASASHAAAQHHEEPAPAPAAKPAAHGASEHHDAHAPAPAPAAKPAAHGTSEHHDAHPLAPAPAAKPAAHGASEHHDAHSPAPKAAAPGASEHHSH
jgi:hypothetical protein